MRKVLVVDDDEDFLFIVEEYLSMSGFECHTATNAYRARKLLKRCEYDLIVSDMEMPGESGLELFRFVSLRRPNTPFILMSGNHDARLKREALRAGVCNFFEKPFALHVLKRFITSPAHCRTDVCVGAPAA